MFNHHPIAKDLPETSKGLERRKTIKNTNRSENNLPDERETMIGV